MVEKLEKSFWFRGTASKIKKIQALIDTFDYVKSTPQEQTVFENYFFIALYSLWESEIYDVVHTMFQKYSQILISETFIKNYYTNVFSSRAPKMKKRVGELSYEKTLKVYEVIQERDLFFDTNNLWYGSLSELLKKCDMNFSLLNEYFEKCIPKDLLNHHLISIPLGNTEGVRPDRTPKEYIDFVVSTRNSIAHSFKSPTGAKYEKDIWSNLLKLFIEIFIVIDEYLMDQLFVKMLEKESPLLKKENTIELVASKRANVNNLKLDFKNEKGDEPTGESLCIIFKEKNFLGYQKIKKFRINTKDISEKHEFDYRLILQEVYKSGGIRPEKDLKFAFCNL